jgi:predicted RNA-binding protein YlqC (UPF0109 family)
MNKRQGKKVEAPPVRVEAEKQPERPSGDSKEESIEARILIEAKQVGCIIGKKGANVQRVREDSGAFVSILKAEYRNVQERVLVVRGAITQVAKSAHAIMQLVLEAQNSREVKRKAPDSGAGSVQLRLLVHKAAVGAIIGQRGATIKETQAQTSTRIQISNDPLPASTEKSVTISGPPDAIHKALTRVLNQLASNPVKTTGRVLPYVPGQSPFPPFPMAPAGPFGAALVYSPPLPYLGSATSTQKIAIPTQCAGSIIGRGGSVIRDLRAQSGTNISIADPDPAQPHERVVTLTGSPQGIQTAVYLISQLVEQSPPY